MDVDLLKIIFSLSVLGVLAVEDIMWREMHDIPLFIYASLNPTLTLFQIFRYRPRLWEVNFAISIIVVSTFVVLSFVKALGGGDVLASTGLFLGHPWIQANHSLFPAPIIMLSISILLTAAYGFLRSSGGKPFHVTYYVGRRKVPKYCIVRMVDGEERSSGIEEASRIAREKITCFVPPPFVAFLYASFIVTLSINLFLSWAA